MSDIGKEIQKIDKMLQNEHLPEDLRDSLEKKKHALSKQKEILK